MITDLLIASLKTLFNLEMNKAPDKGRIKKNNGYAHKLATYTSKTNGKYNKLIQINFNASINFDNELSSEYMIRSRDGKTCADENYVIHHISMVKIVYKYYNNNRLNKFEKAIVMMYTSDKKVLEELSKGDLLTNVKSFLIIIFSKKGQISPYPKINLNYIVLLLLHNIFLKIYLILQFWQMFCFFLLPLFLT